jgi:D-alanyl-D-alanine carboxypeptidase (penicillin-binding protein 5/6)
MALLDWGYRNYQYEKIAEAGDVVGAVAVQNGEEATVDLVASEPIGYLEKRGKEKRNIERIMPTDIVAPISAGEICGKMILREDGVDIVSIDLMAGKSIGKIGFWQILKRNAVRMVTWEASL